MFNYHRFDTAMDVLEAFIVNAASKHHARPSGVPETAAELAEWGRAHTLGVDSLPVSSLHCEHTIYSSPKVNYAFRAWHGSLHLVHGLGMDTWDELRVAQLHQEAIKGQLGIHEGLAGRILAADTSGQTRYHHRHGRFPKDQRAFVLAYLGDQAEALRREF